MNKHRLTKNPEFYEKLGQNVKVMCKAKGYTLKTISKPLGVAYQQTQKYFSGQNRMPIHCLLIIKDLLDCELEDLLNIK